MTQEARIPPAALQARALDIAGERVRWLLSGQTGTPPDLDAGLATLAAIGPVGLHELCTRFGLSGIARDVFLLAAAPELGAETAHAIASHPLSLKSCATPAMATQLLGPESIAALAPNALLSQAALITLSTGTGLAHRSLSIDPGLVQFLHGVPALGAVLAHALTPKSIDFPLGNDEAARLATALSTAHGDPERPIIHLNLPDRLSAENLGAAAIAHLGLTPFVFDHDATDLPAARVAAELNRDLVLLNGGLILTASDASPLADLITAPCLIWGNPAPMTRRPLAEFATKPSATELAPGLSLSPTQTRNAQVTYRLGLAPSLTATARERAARALDGLAQPIAPQARWDDLILPEAQMEQLRQLAAYQTHQKQVLSDWGFRAQSARGLGLAALFAGPSGTGKTMAAELVAAALGQNGEDAALYRVDLSAIVSKYIGETEKNIARIFDAAENSGAVLLFDEGEALFGKRTTDVKDSMDRHANTETAYLLQRLECYTGCAIVTTNLRQTVDEAFLRRFRVVMDFPFPDAAHREQIWRVIFPAETPLEGINYAALSKLAISGGFIRSIALSAAFMAAGDRTAITMAHLSRAARSELGKLGKPLPENQLRGWA
ncbi:ATP-binding protein [Yoonia sp. BS5-3]|uniref:ATP-binding protein n=1 Tax=Yoonia phaeophyticola TaxID=3137369 RepID=A0ABZ2V737_9RHOB